MVDLPYDCWESIISHIDDARDLSRLACVNRSFRDIVSRKDCFVIHVGNKEKDLFSLCAWLVQRLEIIRALHIVGNLSIWCAHWRYTNFAPALQLRHVVLVHTAMEPLVIPSLEDFIPISGRLQTLDIAAVTKVFLYPSVSRYPIESMNVMCPLIYPQVTSLAMQTLKHLCLRGFVVTPDALGLVHLNPIESLCIPSSAVPFCKHLPKLRYLRVYWDGEEEVMEDTESVVIDAPKLNFLELVRGTWTTTGIPQSVETIRLREGTITPDERFRATIHESEIVLTRKKQYFS